MIIYYFIITIIIIISFYYFYNNNGQYYIIIIILLYILLLTMVPQLTATAPGMASRPAPKHQHTDQRRARRRQTWRSKKLPEILKDLLKLNGCAKEASNVEGALIKVYKHQNKRLHVLHPDKLIEKEKQDDKFRKSKKNSKTQRIKIF